MRPVEGGRLAAGRAEARVLPDDFLLAIDLPDAVVDPIRLQEPAGQVHGHIGLGRHAQPLGHGGGRLGLAGAGGRVGRRAGGRHQVVLPGERQVGRDLADALTARHERVAVGQAHGEHRVFDPAAALHHRRLVGPHGRAHRVDLDHALVAGVHDQGVAVGQSHGTRGLMQLVGARALAGAEPVAGVAVLPDDALGGVHLDHAVVAGVGDQDAAGGQDQGMARLEKPVAAAAHLAVGPGGRTGLVDLDEAVVAGIDHQRVAVGEPGGVARALELGVLARVPGDLLGGRHLEHAVAAGIHHQGVAVGQAGGMHEAGQLAGQGVAFRAVEPVGLARAVELGHLALERVDHEEVVARQVAPLVEGQRLRGGLRLGGADGRHRGRQLAGRGRRRLSGDRRGLGGARGRRRSGGVGRGLAALVQVELLHELGVALFHEHLELGRAHGDGAHGGLAGQVLHELARSRVARVGHRHHQLPVQLVERDHAAIANQPLGQLGQNRGVDRHVAERQGRLVARAAQLRAGEAQVVFGQDAHLDEDVAEVRRLRAPGRRGVEGHGERHVLEGVGLDDAVLGPVDDEQVLGVAGLERVGDQVRERRVLAGDQGQVGAIALALAGQVDQMPDAQIRQRQGHEPHLLGALGEADQQRRPVRVHGHRAQRAGGEELVAHLEGRDVQHREARRQAVGQVNRAPVGADGDSDALSVAGGAHRDGAALLLAGGQDHVHGAGAAVGREHVLAAGRGEQVQGARGAGRVHVGARQGLNARAVLAAGLLAGVEEGPLAGGDHAEARVVAGGQPAPDALLHVVHHHQLPAAVAAPAGGRLLAVARIAREERHGRLHRALARIHHQEALAVRGADEGVAERDGLGRDRGVEAVLGVFQLLGRDHGLLEQELGEELLGESRVADGGGLALGHRWHRSVSYWDGPTRPRSSFPRWRLR
ncbi:hypothetical protein D3C72_500420 [compost metagenome]